MPRVITFNPVARLLQQAPLEELVQLRGAAAAKHARLQIRADTPVDLRVPTNVTAQSEVVVSFALPKTAATLTVKIGSRAGGSGHSGYRLSKVMPDTDIDWTQQVKCTPGKTDAEKCASACRARGTEASPCVGWATRDPNAAGDDMSCCTSVGLAAAAGCPMPAATSLECAHQNSECGNGLPQPFSPRGRLTPTVAANSGGGGGDVRRP